MKRREIVRLGAAVLFAPMFFARTVAARSKYPERPIKLIVPFPPGGINDPLGRIWAEKVKPMLGTVVVENQGGAGGALGAAAVARARPDGYTILLGGSGAMFIYPAAASRPTYDPVRDFKPIAILAVAPLCFVVRPSLPARNLNEFIDYAKVNPGKLSYGSTGVGSLPHVGGELFKILVTTPDLTHVPYKGAGPMLTDLMGGQIPFALPALTAQVKSLHRSGKLRMLAVSTARRNDAAPEIPAATESGLPGMVAQNLLGLYVPARRKRLSNNSPRRRARWRPIRISTSN